MANAVFLCGECGKYFSTIGDIREHSCWGNASAKQGETEVSLDSDIPTTSQSLDESNPADLDENYIKNQCYAYVDEGKWTDDGVKLLIQLFKDHEGEFRNPERKKKEVWETIASELNKEGYLFTTDQVDTKWRNLKKSYWRSKEAQSEIGCPSRFVYEELLDEIFGHTLPQKLQVSRVMPRIIRRALIRDGLEVAGQRGPKRKLMDESMLTAKTTKKRFTREFHEVVNVLEAMREDFKHAEERRQKAEEDQQRQEEEKMRLMIQMHEENMSAVKELVEVIGSLSRKSPFGED